MDSQVDRPDRNQLPTAVELGLRLRQLRVRGGLSQRGLVRALGLSAHSNLVEYELGRRVPPGDIITAYEQLFPADGLRALWADALAERAGVSEVSPRPLPSPAMLPAAVPDFVGRAGPLAELGRLFATPAPATGVVIATIVGSAGIGKTALAVHFAHQVRDRYPDGQLYVNLDGYAAGPPRSPVEALAALLTALGVPPERIPTELDQAAALYRSALAGRRVLVVLDNAYRPDQARPLLPGTAGNAVLVTSRDRLGGLMVHDGARRLSLDVLAPDEAVELLALIAGRDRIEAEPAAASELARVCAHLPLALRLAAASLSDQPHLSVAACAKRLSPLGLVVDGDERGVVLAAFTSSYDRLSPEAATVFRRFGLLPGPDLTVPAAAVLTGTTEPVAARLLDQLAAAHLVDEPVAGRFTVHDLLRQYAASRVAEDDPAERAAALTRLLAWYAGRVDAAAQLLYPVMLRLPAGPGSVEPFADGAAAVAWLDAERPNLVAAVLFGASAPSAGSNVSRFAWIISDSLRGYFCLQMPTVDWHIVARAGLDTAVRDGEPRAVACAHHSLSNLYLFVNRYAEAIEHASRALALARRTEWERAEAAILDTLGTIYWHAGRLTPAATHYARALAINRRNGWRAGQANNLGNLGLVYRESGRLRAALDHFTQAQALDAAATDAGYAEAVTLSNLGEVHHALGDLPRAADHLHRALARARELGDLGGEANALHTLATLHLDRGQLPEAASAAATAVSLAAEAGDSRLEADARNVLGAVHHCHGRAAAAAEEYRRALDLARSPDGGSRSPEAAALIGLAVVEPDPAKATSYGDEALRVARAAGYQVLEAQALTVLADLLIDADPGAAADLARQALERHRETGFRVGEARTLLVLARLDLARLDLARLDLGPDPNPTSAAARGLLADLALTEPDQSRLLRGQPR